MRPGRRDTGLTMIELLVTLTILGTVSIVFLGVGAVSFGNQADTVGTLTDSANRGAVSSRLQSDLKESSGTGTELDHFPCRPAVGAPVLWVRKPGPTLPEPGPDTITVWYTTELTSKAGKLWTLLLRTDCLNGEGDGVAPVAPEGEEFARWEGQDQVQVRCNARPAAGDGCGGQMTWTAVIPDEAESTIAWFPGAPVTDPIAATEFADPPIDQVRIADELAVINGGWTTREQLSLSRPNHQEHPADTVIRFAPSLVEVCVPVNGHRCDDPESAALRVLVNRRLT